MAQPYGYYDESTRRYYVTDQNGQARPATHSEAAQIQAAGGSYMFPTAQERDQLALNAGIGYGYYDESQRQYFVVGRDGRAVPASPQQIAAIVEAGGSWTPQAGAAYVPAQNPYTPQQVGATPEQIAAMSVPQTAQQQQQAGNAAAWQRYVSGQTPTAPPIFQSYQQAPQAGQPADRPESRGQQMASSNGAPAWLQPASTPPPASDPNMYNTYRTDQGNPAATWDYTGTEYERYLNAKQNESAVQGSGAPGAVNPAPTAQAVQQAQTGVTDRPETRGAADRSETRGGSAGGIGGWNTSAVQGADWWKEYSNPAVTGGNQPFRGATDLADAYYTNNDPAALWWQYAESQGHGDQFNRFVANNYEKYQSRFKQLAENNPTMQLRDFMTTGLGRQLYNEFNLQAPQARGLDPRLTNPGRFGTGRF